MSHEMAQSTQANTGFGLGALAKADDLKKRLLFTVGALIVYRLGTFIGCRGLIRLHFLKSSPADDRYSGMFDMFSGGALGRMTIFALDIAAYYGIDYAADTEAVPTLEALKKDGEAGRKQINWHTRYLTVLLALFRAMVLLLL